MKALGNLPHISSYRGVNIIHTECWMQSLINSMQNVAFLLKTLQLRHALSTQDDVLTTSIRYNFVRWIITCQNHRHAARFPDYKLLSLQVWALLLHFNFEKGIQNGRIQVLHTNSHCLHVHVWINIRHYTCTWCHRYGDNTVLSGIPGWDSLVLIRTWYRGTMTSWQ